MLRFAPFLVVFLATSRPVASQPIDPAGLFPSSTLAYAEVHDPAQVADAVAAIVKGSSLEDGLKLMHDRRDANKDPRLFAGTPALASLATLTSPEFLAEVRKLRGAAVGLTGFTKSHDPKIAAVLLIGESSAAAILAKAYLANEATFRRVAVVEGAPVYQSRAPSSVSFDPNSGKPIIPEPAKATEGPLEPTYAYTPGFLFVASNKEAVADVLRCHHEKANDSLAHHEGFKTFLGARKAGVNFCIRLADLVAAADLARKNKKEPLDPASAAYLKFLLNARAVPTIIGHASLRPAGFIATVTLARKPGSPLLDLLDGAVSASTLRICPNNFAGSWTIALPPKEKRANAILQLADAVANAEGEIGKLPSDWVEEIEQKSNLPIRHKYLAAIEAIAVLAPSKQELPARAEPLPMVAIHLETDADANQWIEVLPKLFAAGLRLDQTPTRAKETLEGVPVHSISYGRRVVHFARGESCVVLGLDRNQVAACCTGVNRKNLLTDFTTRKAVLPDSSTAAYGAILPLGLALSDQWSNGGLLAGLAVREPRVPDLPIDGNASPYLNLQQSLFTDKELTTAFGNCPPIVGRVLKNANSMTAELRLDFGPQGAKPIIETLIPIIEKLGAPTSNPNGRFFDR